MLKGKRSYVLNGLHMSCGNQMISDIIYGSSGTHLIAHPVFDEACRTAGQIAVAAALHLKLVHGLTR